jgi:cell division protease FtsH
MVTRFGMSAKLGHLTYGRPLASRFLPASFAPEERNYGEQTAQMIDEEVRRIADESYCRVKKILTQRRAELERIAAELIRRETLDGDQLDKLLATHRQAATASVAHSTRES